MGLGQVRDLRSSTVAALAAEHKSETFAGLADLLQRVPLLHKEALHLIRCGALDGLASSRAGLLAELALFERGGLAQLGFDFLASDTVPELPVERLQWEEQILGIPISVDPLDALDYQGTRVGALSAQARMGKVDGRGGAVRVAGARLPGWTGGAGFFLGDRSGYLLAIGPRGLRPPPAWQAIEATGRWRFDEWGGVALQLDGWHVL
jgi:hypothetical protein